MVFEDVNAAVDALMADDMTDEFVMVALGGDASKQAELAEIKTNMNAAMAKGDMATVTPSPPVTPRLARSPRSQSRPCLARLGAPMATCGGMARWPHSSRAC